jgi:hypothetical protein
MSNKKNINIKHLWMLSSTLRVLDNCCDEWYVFERRMLWRKQF